MKRILALLLSLAVLCTVLVVNVPQAEAAVDGMVRVWLKSMDYYGSISSTSITLNGSYSVPANPDVVLSTRGEYTIEVVGGTLMLPAFVVVTIGGLSSIPGAMVAGLLVGVVESLSAYLLGATYQQLAYFVLFILVVLFKPQGILAKKGA